MNTCFMLIIVVSGAYGSSIDHVGCFNTAKSCQAAAKQAISDIGRLFLAVDTSCVKVDHE